MNLRPPNALHAAATLLVMLPLAATLDVAIPAQAASKTSFADRLEAAITVKTNEARADHDRKPVTGNQCVDTVAERWVRHLSETDTFEHNRLGKILRRCDRTFASENLARTPVNPLLSASQIAQVTVEAWLASPEHRENLLAKRAKVTGVGIRKNSEGTYWLVVQNFANRP